MNAFIEYLEREFAQNITAKVVLPASEGQFSPLPPDLAPELRQVLEEQGVTRLYSHQATAYGEVRANHDVALVSRTASGKTLSFLLPILQEYLASPARFSVLLLYPTKALSRDQEGTLAKMLRAVSDEKRLGTFDGDTPTEMRRMLQRNADFVITNPDMLHSGILPNQMRSWRVFLSRLRYIVVDEVHSYRGSFGSHVANVFRRLLRAAELAGSHPAFVCCSATVGNPGEHVAALIGRPVTVVDNDGAPRPERLLYCINPPTVESEEGVLFRKGTRSLSVPLLRKASEQGIRTICFCRARQEVERLYGAVIDGRYAYLKSCVKPYRGGLLPNERRQLERDLFEGRLRTIISTNALELGIDIGGLDLCILSGHPGTLASFWQQAGRVGRGQSRAVIIYLAKDTPIDQYLVNHHEFITGSPVEQAWLNADNPYIVLQHLPCAAQEYPLSPNDPYFSSPAALAAAQILQENGTLKPWHGGLRYALSDYPARGVNLRGMTDYNIQIYCGTEVIGEIDPIGARGTLYKDAIYQHLGRRYMSRDLDLERKLCQVEEVNVDYFTEASWENRLDMTEQYESKEQQTAPVKFGAVHVNQQPKLYKKIRERTFENIGYGPITLPAFEYDSTGFSIQPPPAWLNAVDAQDKRWLGAAFFGLAYLLRRTSPSLCMADISDIDTDVALVDMTGDRFTSALYLYDTHEGGVGYAEKIYERLPEALELCRSVLRECPCRGGCPACVPAMPPGVVKDEALEELLVVSDASVRCTESLLTALCEGIIILPKVTVNREHVPHPVAAPPEDLEQKRLMTRLQRAAIQLQARRQREH